MSLACERKDGPGLALQLYSDELSALKMESEIEMKRRTARNEESIEMDTEIWNKLPEEVLVVILSSLPTLISRDLRVICKRWLYLLSPAPMFRQISSTLVPSSSPAFYIGEKRDKYFPHSSFLLHSQPLAVYPLSFDFIGPDVGNVFAACKSILCCFSRYVKGAPSSYYICNPLTRTWITVPPDPCQPTTSQEFGFHGLAFDSAIRTCILVIGSNNPINGENNNMELQIYDSDTKEWTIMEMNLPISIFPWREGVYSRGRFYWINVTFGEYTDMFAFDVVAFNVVEKNWDVVKLPNRSISELDYNYLFDWDLTGYDGNVIAVENRDLSLWKLNEERCSWLELQLFPRSLHEENAKRLCATFSESKVVVNSCGWVLVHLHRYKTVVFDAEGRMVRCIQGNLHKVFDQFVMPIPLYAYEINNIWWP